MARKIQVLEEPILTGVDTFDRPILILHICTTNGGWGSKTSSTLARRWRSAASRWRQLPKTELVLGTAQVTLTEEEEGVYIGSLLAQEGVCRNGHTRAKDAPSMVQTEALLTSLGKARSLMASKTPYTVHVPRLGTGLARGDWNTIASAIESVFSQEDIYYYPPC